MQLFIFIILYTTGGLKVLLTFIMSNDNNNELTFLKKQLQTHEYRTSILNFQITAYRFNSRCRFLLNDRNNFHLNNCIWSTKNAECGPDTCHCCFVLDSPETFFEQQIKNPTKYFSVSDFHPFNNNNNSNTKDYKKNSKPYLVNEEEESLHDFYYYRVLDSQNILKWYEMYKKKSIALQFRIKMRELKKEHRIDAVYNIISQEWHLTDCERSIHWQSGPDTCHCHKAMLNPWKYLKQRYNFVDMQKVQNKFMTQTLPKYYK